MSLGEEETSMSEKKSPPTGVILMTMGDVASIGGVFPFLVRLFSDPSIIRAPGKVRYPLSVYIALKKLPTMVRRYRAIGGGSPMNGITNRQAELLQERLSEYGDYRVYVANRYCRPFTRDAYRAAKSDGVRKIIALPLYPHFSTATTGSNQDALRERIEADPDAPEVAWVRSFADDPAYIAAMTAKINEALGEIPEEERIDTEILFSAHSLPHEFVKQGDPYLDEIRLTLTGVIKQLKPSMFSLCFQSKGGGKREWLKPETDAVLEGLAEKKRNAVLVPISFVAENIETLYDADILYGDMARGLGIKRFVRVKCLDTEPAFIDCLAAIVKANA